MRYSVTSVRAREILDSRGNPTIEVEIVTEGNVLGSAAIPSGASTGMYEAVELRDGGKRFGGKGVAKAVDIVTNTIQPKIKGMDVRRQNEIDAKLIELDGTENKSKLGGNAILGVSIACARAAAASDGLRLYEYIDRKASLLPVPFFNVINGGKHAGNQLDFQEFMIAPIGARSFREAIQIGAEVYQALKTQLQKTYGKSSINVGDEGGFAPPLRKPEEALDIIYKAIQNAGYMAEVKIGLDVASSTFYKNGAYTVTETEYTTDEIIDYYRELVAAYPIISIEDPLQEEDYEGFAEATRVLPTQVVGDDLFVTNPKRLAKGIEMGACNALLWKVNQIGTLTEALEAASLAMKNKYGVMASHRSGDTEDPWVADLSVGIGCGQIKSGAPARGERTAKYNQLLRIEEWLGSNARYPKGSLRLR
ncbi:phosphopyruvate hydratase [Candidatus Bathyarchaeota archaeon RBG_13_52_12]|nr:MAG: phosphopyruvate hydratase [Candidatus Bathyarchaeota archaeon RBG_13_52_12]